MMIKREKQKGFTLVELAIVLVIVGLLIGGILKGQQLMENASITATVAQVRSIEAATTNFMDTYGALPGDLLDAANKITGCNNSAGTSTLCEGSGADMRFHPGDGVVGNTTWDMITYQPGTTDNDDATTALTGGADYGMETLLFWHSLQQAGLINAVTNPMANGGGDAQAFGRTIPAAEIAGGFWAGYTSSSDSAGAQITGPDGLTYSLLGTVLSLVAEPGLDIDVSSNDANAVTPVVAATIDRKIDDGLPNSGYVQALGHNDCVDSTAWLYNEQNEKMDCGIHIVIVPQS